VRKITLLSIVLLGIVFASDPTNPTTPTTHVYFSPSYTEAVWVNEETGESGYDAVCPGVISMEICQASKTIDVAMYSFTGVYYASCLIYAAEKGVKVRVLLDKQQAGSKFCQAAYLDSNGIEVRIEDWSGYMHHKFAVFDSSKVLTGSYNWMTHAEDNNETLILFEDDSLSCQFLQEFQRLWEKARKVPLK